MSSSQLMAVPEIVGQDNKPLNMYENFAIWIFNKTTGGAILSKHDLAREISKIRGNARVEEHHVTSWISKARVYLEHNKQVTLWCVPGVGWRISTDRETAVYYAKCVKKTISWADRTRALQLISKRQYIPGALQEVFGKAEGGINTLSKTKKRYFEQFAKYQLAERLKDEQKQLA